MMGRITDYGWMLWCENCGHGFINQEYDHDADMCKECAKVFDDATGGEE